MSTLRVHDDFKGMSSTTFLTQIKQFQVWLSKSLIPTMSYLTVCVAGLELLSLVGLGMLALGGTWDGALQSCDTPAFLPVISLAWAESTTEHYSRFMSKFSAVL